MPLGPLHRPRKIRLSTPSDQSFRNCGAASPQTVTALGFDGALRNRRPVFALTETLSFADDSWRASRVWRAAGPDPVAAEQVVWRNGLVESVTEIFAIQEYSTARKSGETLEVTLRSHRTGGRDRSKRLTSRRPVATPGSLPLLIASVWPDLRAGRTIEADYLIVKLPWITPVSIRRVWTGAPGVLRAAVVPSNPMLRLLFGAAHYDFDAQGVRLLNIEGVLDPRDLKRRGGWREYRGVIGYDAPLDLSALTPPEAAP